MPRAVDEHQKCRQMSIENGLVVEFLLQQLIVVCQRTLRGYPKTFSHCHSKIKQHPCGNETQDDRRERAYSA